jgi:hypothetical protein
VNSRENKVFRVQSMVNNGCFGFMSKERVLGEKKRVSSSEFVEEGSKNDGVRE